MRFLTKIKILAVMLLLAVTMAVAQVPSRPEPPRLVNDLAGVLTRQQAQWLEDSLARFDRRTSNQVLVVTIADLDGMDPAQMAYEIGEQWGVGEKGVNNGVVILVKPKTAASRGQAFIATGYGLEGALPDATCKMIVEREMIPHFRQNDYFGGIVAAVGVVCPIAAGEYSKERYGEGDFPPGLAFAILFGSVLLFFVIVALSNRGGGKGSGGSGGSSGTFGPDVAALPFLLGGLGRGHSSGGVGGGGFSGGGGFGGFGGGSFGGGGAGGSW